MTEVDAILAKHRSDGKRLCYAVTLAPVTTVHQFGNRAVAKVLRCTRPLGHTDERDDATHEQHVDGACCWTPHRFDPGMAGPPEPEHYSWERCVECGQQWPCDVALIGDLLAGTIVVHHPPVNLLN